MVVGVVVVVDDAVVLEVVEGVVVELVLLDVVVADVVVVGAGVAAGATIAVASEVPTADPFLLLAVTTTRSVEPTSVAVSAYV